MPARCLPPPVQAVPVYTEGGLRRKHAPASDQVILDHKPWRSGWWTNTSQQPKKETWHDGDWGNWKKHGWHHDDHHGRYGDWDRWAGSGYGPWVDGAEVEDEVPSDKPSRHPSLDIDQTTNELLGKTEKPYSWGISHKHVVMTKYDGRRDSYEEWNMRTRTFFIGVQSEMVGPTELG